MEYLNTILVPVMSLMRAYGSVDMERMGGCGCECCAFYVVVWLTKIRVVTDLVNE